ncbi:ammonium transporter [Acinetobacter puyangensis]|uniref:ammonium transporter n=1 Tax=Acinetobacter puyangensis TaxID=1096779 RepID=UPI003A4DB324
MNYFSIRNLAWVGCMALCSNFAFAADVETLNQTSTAWVITATVLVMIMFIPGLALFYGGMIRGKNVLSICTQFFAFAGIVGLMWIAFLYSLVVDATGMQEGVFNIHSFIGGLDKAFLKGMTEYTMSGEIPEYVLTVFLMTFAMITPAIVVGGYAERMKFGALIMFVILWPVFVYAPMAHMVWGGPGSAMHNWGVLDFAGGTAVHINSGIAALVGALMLGRRKGWKTSSLAPHNLVYTFIGAGLLWAGWFGFNVGSALAANHSAALIFMNTQVAACGGIVGWMLIEKITNKHVTSLGLASGAIAGLVGITPAASFVGPFGASVIGLLTGMVCFFAVTRLKHKLNIDDSLDVFALHGIGGIVGGILTGIFAAPIFGGNVEGLQFVPQFFAQMIGIIVTIVYSAFFTWLIFKIIDLTVGLRVSEEHEEQGLDLSDHNERAYNG